MMAKLVKEPNKQNQSSGKNLQGNSWNKKTKDCKRMKTKKTILIIASHLMLDQDHHLIMLHYT